MHMQQGIGLKNSSQIHKLMFGRNSWKQIYLDSEVDLSTFSIGTISKYPEIVHFRVIKVHLATLLQVAELQSFMKYWIYRTIASPHISVVL